MVTQSVILRCNFPCLLKTKETTLYSWNLGSKSSIRATIGTLHGFVSSMISSIFKYDYADPRTPVIKINTFQHMLLLYYKIILHLRFQYLKTLSVNGTRA